MATQPLHLNDGKAAPDALLAQRAAAGDRAAFRAIYDRWLPRVRAQVGRLVGFGADNDDIVQDVFVQLHRSLPTFRGDAAFGTWFYRLTWNVTVSRLRRAQPVVEMTTLRLLQLASSDWSRLEARDLVAVLQAALDQVSPEGRSAFIQHYVEGMTLQEIANLHGAPLHTIAARVRRTREKVCDTMAAAIAASPTDEDAP